jgi:hypothetical protein
MHRRLLTLLLLSCCIAAWADDQGPKLLSGIPLLWRPTTDQAVMSDLVMDDMTQTKIQIAKLTDARPAPEIGVNHERTPPRPVTTKDDVAAFITSHLHDILAHAGLAVVDGGAQLTLSGEISSYSVDEVHTYHAVTTLKLTLRDSAGDMVWSGVTGGVSTHFGRSYIAENYYEALSDSLVDTIHNLIIDPGFHKALAGK